LNSNPLSSLRSKLGREIRSIRYEITTSSGFNEMVMINLTIFSPLKFSLLLFIAMYMAFTTDLKYSKGNTGADSNIARKQYMSIMMVYCSLRMKSFNLSL
jgi:hypothetical protein